MAEPAFEVLKRNAEWAGTFGPASTNLAQRRRYAQDQEAYAADLLGQQQAAMVEEARRDKTAQNFFFRQQELDRKTQMDRFKMDQDHQKAQWENELVPLKMETERARADAARALEVSRLRKEKADAEKTLRVVTDTTDFESGIDSLLQTVRPGSETFAKGVLGLVAKHPFVPNDLRSTWVKQADIDADPDELMREMGRFKDTHDISITMSPSGKWGAAARPKAAPKPEKAPDLGTITTSSKAEDGTTTRISRPRTEADNIPTTAPVVTEEGTDAGARVGGAVGTVVPKLRALDAASLAAAKAAIAAGKDAAAVKKRIQDAGFIPEGL